MNKKYWLLIACMGFAVQSLASDTKSVAASQMNDEQQAQGSLQHTISQAIAKFEQTSRQDWSYRITRYENEEGDISSSIELFDPIKEQHEQWSLLRIDGQAPTEKQVKKFVKSKRKEKDDSDQQSLSVKLGDIILLNSLQLVSEDQNHLRASFDVYLSQLGEEATENLKGSLIFAKDEQFIESIEIINKGEFSPVFSAAITDFKLSFRFVKIDSAILPQQNDLSMKGTFAFFTEIDEVSTDTYSDYQYVGQVD